MNKHHLNPAYSVQVGEHAYVLLLRVWPLALNFQLHHLLSEVRWQLHLRLLQLQVVAVLLADGLN